MTLRQGLGRTKHVEIQMLWLQGQVANKQLEVNKINRDKNVADLLTHHWTIAEGARHLPRLAVCPLMATSIVTMC